jgi:hypothetical protein
MKVEGYLLGIDELMLGFSMNYGHDENGDCHIISFGLLIFQLDFVRYLKND